MKTPARQLIGNKAVLPPVFPVMSFFPTAVKHIQPNWILNHTLCWALKELLISKCGKYLLVMDTELTCSGLTHHTDRFLAVGTAQWAIQQTLLGRLRLQS